MYDCTRGGSANGDLLFSFCSMGECTVVASAKRGVRGILRDDADEELDVRSRCRGSGLFFSLSAEGGVSCLYGQLEGGD
jgi:hypothetical protein